MRRLLGLAAFFGGVAGCGPFWGLDGLSGGQCQGACNDASVGGDDVSSAVDTGEAEAAPRDASDATADTKPAEDSGPPDDGSSTEADASQCTPPTTFSLDDCTGIVAMPAAPVIDGILDCGVPLWTMPTAAWTGSSPMPAGVHARVAAAWRTDGLYVFVQVTGIGAHRFPPPAGTGQWCGDAVELFVDDDGSYVAPPAYDNPGTLQFILVSPPDSAVTSSVAETFRDASDVGPWAGQFMVMRTADGFDAEAFLVASDLGLTTWSLAKGGHVGLDVSVDIGDPSQSTPACPLLGQFTIQLPQADAACTKAACNVGEFCRPQLE